LLSCQTTQNGAGQEGQNQPSPNASILPAPLLSATEPAAPAKTDSGPVGIPADSAGRLIVPEAGPPEPTPFPDDQALPRDTITAKDGVGATLDAHFRWLDVPSPHTAPELVGDAVKKARDKTALKLTVDLAPVGRMRFAFASAAFPLPMGAELRAHSERYGHVLVWPDANAYRVVRAGMLRALLSERRADALPLTVAKATPQGKGSYLGFDTVKHGVKSSLGELSLESGNVPGVGRAGELLCRLLLDLVAVDPASKICPEGATPLRAELRWPKGGKLAFEVAAIAKKPELPFGGLFVPPAGAKLELGELPPQASGVLLTREDISAFRAKAVTGEPPPKDAPGEGILAVNRTDSIRYLLLDGVPVAWVRPRSEQLILGPHPGSYSVAWRDFLGGAVEPAAVLTLPARVSVGPVESDAGPPPPL
jgi:hypothetical protein